MIKETLICVILALLPWQTHSEIQCLMGASDPTGTHNELINCTHQYQTKQEVVSNGNSTHVNVSYSYHHPESKDHPDIDYCLIFLYVSETDNAAPRADFMCDFHYKCDNLTTTLGLNVGFEYQGNLGNLYCCNTTGCNDRRKLQDLKQIPEIECKVGSVNSTNSATLDNKRCPGTSCMKRRVWNTQGREPNTEYNCALQELCRGSYNLPDYQCKNITYEGQLQELCCCSTAFCNTLSVSWGSTSHEVTTQTLPNTPLAPMPNSPTSVQKHNTWNFVIGIVAALFLGILLFAIVAIVIKKYKRQRNNEETYTYTQLTADLAESPERDTDDEHMIVG